MSPYDLVTHNFIGQNNIVGTGAFALQISTFLGQEQASSNAFVGNNIARFRSSIADVFFDVNSMNNVLNRDSGTLIDLGTGM